FPLCHLLRHLPAGCVVLTHALGRRRELLEKALGPRRALDQIAAAIGADAAQAAAGAVRTKGALEGADQGVGRAVGQVLVAAFAIGAQLKHDPPSTDATPLIQSASTWGIEQTV